MAHITVVGTFDDGDGQFSETVDAADHAEAERLVRGLLAPRDIRVAGFFDYGGDGGVLSEDGSLADPDDGRDDPPESEIAEADDHSASED